MSWDHDWAGESENGLLEIHNNTPTMDTCASTTVIPQPFDMDWFFDGTYMSHSTQLNPTYPNI